MMAQSLLKILHSRKTLPLLFLITFLLVSVFKLPASLITIAGTPAGLKFNAAAGSVWQGRLSHVTFDGQYFERLDFTLHPKSFFLGDPYGRFTLMGDTKNISGHIGGRKEGAWSFPRIDIKSEISLPLANIRQKAILSIQGQNMMLKGRNSCIAGQMNAQAHFKTGPLAALAGKEIIMTGQGQCRDGGLYMNLASEDASLPLSLTAQMGKEGMETIVRLRKLTALNQNIALQNMLRQNGFKETDQYWLSQIPQE